MAPKIWVCVPPSEDPALKGMSIVRRPGRVKGRRLETGEQILSGLIGGPDTRGPRADRASYFTEEPEEVELTPQIQRMIVTGSLIECGAPAKE